MSEDGLFDASEVEVGLTGRPVRELPEPAPLESHGPATILSMCNQKGGVGKTTSTINLGACLAEAGRKVLLVDLDPQGALSAGLGLTHDEIEDTIVPGEKPTRSAASPADASAAEHIYLESTIKDNVITAQMGVSQALDLYNRFKDMDRNSVTLRYIDADGNIIEGVQRDINTTARTLTLTYPEGQAPDNPFIMQLIREDGSGVVADVTLRDPHYASADHVTREQLEEEQAAHDSADSSNTKLIVAGVVIVVLIVALIAALVALARKRRSARSTTP